MNNQKTGRLIVSPPSPSFHSLARSTQAFDKVIEFKRDGTVGGGGGSRVTQEMEIAMEQGGNGMGQFMGKDGVVLPLAYGGGNSTRKGGGR